MTAEQLGAEARRVLDDEFFVHVFKTLEEKYIADIVNSQPVHREVREDAYRMIQATRALRAVIEGLAVEERVKNFNRGLRSKRN